MTTPNSVSQDSLGKEAAPQRDAKDYAIEHGWYLANAARYLLGALNELDAARITHEERDDDNSRDDLECAGETAIGARTGLRSAIHEFEKRRDRALAASPAALDSPKEADGYEQRMREFMAARGIPDQVIEKNIQIARAALPKQIPLDPRIAKAIADNLWDLYSRDAALDSPRVEMAKDELDARRYRWLRDNVKRTQWRNAHRLRDGDLYVLRQTERDEADILHGAALDAAIDAAASPSPTQEQQQEP